MNLESLKGRSIPSSKFGAWIVDQVSATMEVRSRLVTGDLKREQTISTQSLVNMFEILDSEIPTQEKNEWSCWFETFVCKD